MGAWGVKALESDDGLDVIEFLTENYLPEHTTLKMEDMIPVLKKEGFFGDILALIELYVEWIDTGKLAHDYDDDDVVVETLVWSKVTDFTVSRDSLDFLLRYLYNLRNGVPDKNTEQEIEEWRDSDSWEERCNHLDTLTQRLEQEKKK